MSGRILDMQTRIYNLLNAWFPEPAAGGEPVGNILDTETAIYELLSARFEQMPGDIADAVMTYLEEHPTALDQAAVEAILDGRLDEIEDDLSGLKSALNEFEDGYTPESVVHLNLLDSLEPTSTTKYYRINNAGHLALDSNGTYNSYLIDAKPDQQYTSSGLMRYVIPCDADKEPLVASTLNNISSIDTTNYPGIKYLAVSINNNTYDISTFAISEGETASTQVVTTPPTLPGWAEDRISPIETDVANNAASIGTLSSLDTTAKTSLVAAVNEVVGSVGALETDIDDVGNDLTAFKDGYEVITLNLLEDLTPTSETKYYSKGVTSGKLIMSSSSGSATYSSWLIPVDGTSNYTMSYLTRFIFAVASDGETVIGDGLDNKTSIDTSEYEGCKYIAISLRTDTLAPDTPISQYYVSKGNTARTGTETILPGWCEDRFEAVEESISEMDVKPKKNKVFMLTDTSFSEEKAFPDFATSTKGKCMHLVVNLSSFTSVTVGLRDSTRPVFYAQVSSDSVYLYDYNGGNTAHTQTYTHGLTIGDNLSIDVYANANTNLYYVQIGTNGTEYTTPAYFSIAPTGLIYPYASMEGSASFVQFSAECNTQRPIWLFGDSYLGTYNNARWAYYLVNREKDSRVMMDSFAGEGSTSSYASLGKLIECGVPDYIVWCLGMNDGSDTGSTPSSTWLGKIESLIELCEANNVTPILATIPTVPSIYHEAKNAWVRESGYQYIDFAKAVGASDQGVWFDGMLSSDNVHPTQTGAITLYHAALAGCPQFNQK